MQKVQKGAVLMTAMVRKSAMNMSADAMTAPACQSASMYTACAMILDTAVLAVSFLFSRLLGIVSEVVRIILPRPAKP